jgi:hypothetical protein
MSYGLTDAEDGREEYIAGLRQLADVLEQHPEIVIPSAGRDHIWTFDFNYLNRAELVAIAKAMPGSKEKDADSASFRLSGKLRGLYWAAEIAREQVCTAKVVGTETQTRKVATAFEEVTETVDKIEWVCEPLLAEVAS